METLPRTVGNVDGQRGAGLAEYALLLLFIAVVVVLAVTTLGQTLSALFDSAASIF